MKYALRVEKLTKRFKSTRVLQGLDLAVRPGTTLGLVGPNGSGKTTTLSIIAGILKPTGGYISLFDEGPFDSVKHKGKISLLPQDTLLPKHLHVRELLIFLARLQGMTKSEARSSADTALNWTQLSHRARSPIKTLSHGMFRRLTIAQAFLGNPLLVLLDEPISGLDPAQIINIRELLSLRKTSQTIIISSHILSEIETVCDEIAFIDDGKTVRHETLDTLIEKNKQVIYVFERGVPPMERLETLFPYISFSYDAKKQTLTLRFPENAAGIAAINRKLIPILFESGVDILDIRSGSNLESVYLAYSGNSPQDRHS